MPRKPYIPPRQPSIMPTSNWQYQAAKAVGEAAYRAGIHHGMTEDQARDLAHTVRGLYTDGLFQPGVLGLSQAEVTRSLVGAMACIDRWQPHQCTWSPDGITCHPLTASQPGGEYLRLIPDPGPLGR